MKITIRYWHEDTFRRLITAIIIILTKFIIYFNHNKYTFINVRVSTVWFSDFDNSFYSKINLTSVKKLSGVRLLVEEPSYLLIFTGYIIKYSPKFVALRIIDEKQILTVGVYKII